MNPVHWPTARLDNIGRWGSGGTPRRGVAGYYGGDIPWLKIGDLNDGVVAVGEEFITQRAIAESSSKLIPPGAVLLAMYGSIGKLGISGAELATNQAIAHCVPDASKVLSEFLFYWLLERRPMLIRMGKGGTQLNISQSVIRALEMPVPSLDEQQRVVGTIEAHFNNLGLAVSSLTRAKANVKRARAAIRKAAVEGRLVPTEAELARMEGRDFEPAPVLLERGLASRKLIWAQAVSKGRFSSPAIPDLTGLDELPEGWAWASVDQVASPDGRGLCDGPFGSNLKTEHYTEVGPRVIRLQNIGDGHFKDERAHISYEHFEGLKKHEICAGDLAVASLGESLPRACVIPSWVGSAIVKADCIRFRPDRTLTSSDYMNLVLNSPLVRKRTTKKVHGVGRPRLGLNGIREIQVPLPPLAEQVRIVVEVDRRLSVLDAIDATLDANLSRCAQLRQSILKRAFEGRLVPSEIETPSFDNEKASA